jgi:isopenicillin N synthase-like dioxygenase
MTSSIPTVDLTPFVGECGGCVIGDEPTPAQLACATSIADACREHGFMRVRNLGFPQERVRDMFASTASLFAMSEADKTSKLNPYDPARNTGYSAFATEALNAVRPPDLKEAFNIRCREHFDNDYRGAPPGFGEMAESMWDDLEIVSRRLFLACALALDLPRDDLGFFERTFKRMDQCTLRFLHFPPCEYAAGAQDDVDATLRIGEHVDFGMITLLFHDGEAAGEGLQVKKAEMGAVGG